ncbi:uncharacterized protein EV420DRAFT_1489038 [Desarmillaria tabescens]|uniref:Uncharacterized protein n=1 Tax=Armillaria tabescens TaxID=1929756 RepID=A0AA39MGM3_ARMTA|nr:uncharacterized protein EV420DRAFT_1489038 [Desarmillaria tabescens]KAK0433592.1 hypothetical protein EV420DRAFT_1489038 [Desarmillaria tabescens]
MLRDQEIIKSRNACAALKILTAFGGMVTGMIVDIRGLKMHTKEMEYGMANNPNHHGKYLKNAKVTDHWHDYGLSSQKLWGYPCRQYVVKCFTECTPSRIAPARPVNDADSMLIRLNRPMACWWTVIAFF